MNKRLTLLLAVLLPIIFYSCRKSDSKSYPGDYTRGYFPLQFGKYVVYDLDSIIWDDFQCVRSQFQYQMRYTVADTFRDNENRLSYRMDVHIRRNDTAIWRTHRVVYLTPTATSLEYVEANVRFIKMVFPVSNGTYWLGNAMIPAFDADYQYFQDWEYRYSKIGETFSTGKAEFPNTVTINQVDRQINDPELQPGAYAEKTYGKEVYAFDVGMVYRETTRWVYDPGVVACRKGYSVVMRAIDHN